MVIHGNLYTGVTLVSTKQEQIKTIECYELIHEHNSYLNLMGHVVPSHHQDHHPPPPSSSLQSPTDDRAHAGLIKGYPTINQAAKTGSCDGAQG